MIKILGVYENKNEELFRVIDVGTHIDTGEELVMLRSVKEDIATVVPVDSFIEDLQAGELIYRGGGLDI